MNKKTKYYFSILLIFCFLSVAGQNRQIQFENFSTKQGLPHFSLNHIIEDHFGFLWFATNSGLFRFDGYNLKNFLHDVHDTASVSSPGVHFVTEDKLGQIWVSTIYGLNLLDRRTGKFKQFLPYPSEISSKGKNIIRDLLVDSDNRLFALGNENLFLFDRQTMRFKMINNAEDPSKRYKVKSIIETSDGTIWCSVGTGLIKILPRDTLYTFVALESGPASKVNKEIFMLAAAEDNKLWISYANGLILYDTKNQMVESNNILPKEFRTQTIRALLTTHDGNLLIAFSNNGLGVLQSNNKFEHYNHSDEKFNSLQNNRISCIMEDQFENIWLGTVAGISKITAEKSGVKLLQNKSGLDQRANNISRILKDQQGTIWMNSEYGIYSKTEKEEIGQLVQFGSKGKIIPFTESICQERNGNIWIPIVGDGIWKKDISSSSFKKVALGSLLDKIFIFKIIEDSEEENILWLGTEKGLCKLNSKTYEYKLYKPLDQISELRSNHMIVFSEFENDIWIYYSYHNSIGRFDKDNEKFELIRPPLDQQYMLEGVFRDMTVSNDGNVWFATNFGLTQYDSNQRTFRIFTKREGLIENDLNSVVIDNQNQLWVAGQQFIGKYNQENQTFTCFDKSETVEFFLPRAAHASIDGQLFFGCLNGVLAFYPDSMSGDLIKPKIILTDFRVRDSTFLLEEAFESTTNIRLAHNQNDIAFEFAGIHYTDPSANQYRCILEGFDDNWRYLGHDNHVTYTNLNPGQFKFRLSASTRDGIWNEEELLINVLITPPFTQTNWFRALIALIFISMVYVVFKIRQSRLILNSQKEFAEKSAAYKTQFLADVSHEIRTPMNAIIGLSKLTLETELDSRQAKFVGAIQESSNNLLTIINDLLDHTKLEAGKFKFFNKSFGVTDIIRQLDNLFSFKAEEKELNFELNLKGEIPKKIIGDPIRLNQILINLLGNAFKFTEKGNVWLTIEKQNETYQHVNLRFEVGDTGIGIPKDKIEAIFENYYQAEVNSTKGMEGTGLGLSIAQQLVEKQGGKLYIESEVNVGTRIWFDLSFEKVLLEENAELQAANIVSMDQLSILLVEDTYFNQMLVVEILKKHIKNPEIVLAENGKLALEKLSNQYFDIVLMDVKMPVMDGFEATRIIRSSSDERLKKVPILAVTASAVPEQLQKCKDAGMNDYVTKPIEEKALLLKIYQLTLTQK